MILTGRVWPSVPSRYERALDSVVDKLLQRSAVTDLLYVAELISGTQVGG